VAGLLTGAVAAIVSTDPFDADVFADAPSLRVVARVGVGVDSIDLAAATAAGVVVTTTPGANEVPVADHTLALMLSVLRRIAEHDAGVRRGEWNRTGPSVPMELTGATVGLVGFGTIGRLVAERLRGFGVRLLVSDPLVDPGAGPDLEVVALPELLARADIVSLHAPLTDATHHLIGARELASMARHAILVNTSRGPLVDEEALRAALASGHLRGVGLDVFEHEPPDPTLFGGDPRVVLSPHIGGLSERSIDEMTQRATASVLDVLAGRPPLSVANPAVLDRLIPTPVSAR